MRIVVDFDGTIVNDDHEYYDLITPLTLKHGAREALRALHHAGHTLILSSGRANRALRVDWRLNPSWRDGLEPFDSERWARNQPLNQARYEQMIHFVDAHLPDVFVFVDDGAQGKVSGDLYIDDRGLRYGASAGWPEIAAAYGDGVEGG